MWELNPERKAMNKFTILFLATILILLGCAAPEPPTATANDISSTNVASEEYFTATPGFTEVPTTDDPGQFHVDEKCPTIEDGIPDGFSMKGTLVLSSSSSNVFMLTPFSGEMVQVEIPDIQLSPGSVSPDGKVLAYATGEWKKQLFYLMFSDNRNNILKSIAWDDDWYLIGGWINENQLAILAYGQKLELISPYTDQRETISTVEMGFPDFSNYNLSRPWVLFSPDMKKAVYSEFNEEILLEVESKKKLFVIPRYGYELIEAAWSKDSSTVAIAGQNSNFINDQDPSPVSHQEIHVLAQEGSEIQVTNFADSYRSGTLIYHPSWSPDGSSVAFWMYDGSIDYPYYKLAVYHLDSSTATTYCLSRDMFRGIHNDWYAAPIWSPDSRQVLIESHHGDTDSAVIVLDIPTNKAVKITEDSQPVGWMLP